MTADSALVREAFHLSGEKHFAIARLGYPLVFGARWREAILAFAYLKCLDDLIDEDPDHERALAMLADQRALIARAYAGAAPGHRAAVPERYGLPVFHADRARGARLRRPFEAILASMEFDTRRRGVQLDAAALDAYVVDLGSAILVLFAEIAAPGVALPAAVLCEGSRAYLYADALMDLQHDLRLGVVNVPRGEGDWRAWAAADGDAPRRAWVAARVPRVLEHFAAARRHFPGVQPWTLRAFLALYLAAKRHKMRRFLAASPASDGEAAPTAVASAAYAAAAAAEAGSGSR